MNTAEDFKKMGDQFMTDYQNRIGTLRACFRDTRQMLSQIRPSLATFRRNMGHETQKMMTDFRTSHKKMSTEMHQFLKETTRRIKSDTNRMRSDAQRMMGTFHTQSNHRKAEAGQMHHAAQAFFKAMAHARHMHPLRGAGRTTEETPTRKHTRKRKRRQPASQ